MLNAQSIPILKAAVRFLEEEFSPAGVEAIQSEIRNSDVTPADLKQVRHWLAHAHVMYVSPHDLQSAPSAEHTLIPVLVTSDLPSNSVE